MKPPDVFRRALETLDRLGVEYFVGGSIASSHWGKARLTEDLDIVVSLRWGDVPELCAAFPLPEFYLSKDAVVEALRLGTQCNLIHAASGFKVDFMMLPDSPFAASQMARRQRREILTGVEGWVASMEDVILSKLLYYREGRSDKHINDIAFILQRRRDVIDRKYLDDWAARLGVTAEWREAQERTPPK